MDDSQQAMVARSVVIVAEGDEDAMSGSPQHALKQQQSGHGHVQ